MTWPARRAAAGKASGTEARDLGPGAAGGDRSRPGGIAQGEGYPRLGSASGDKRKRVLRLMRENNLLSPHRCRRRGGNPHDGEIITHAPNLMWGTDGVRVFTVDDLHRRRALERRVCRMACLQARRPLRRCSRSPWGLPGCMARWPCGRSRVSVGPLHQPIKFWGIQPLRLRRSSPSDQRRAERNRTLKEQIMVASTATSRSCGTPSATSRTLQCPVDRRKERLPCPAAVRYQARQAWHNLNQAQGSSVQGTGCPSFGETRSLKHSKFAVFANRAMPEQIDKRSPMALANLLECFKTPTRRSGSGSPTLNSVTAAKLSQFCDPGEGSAR